jgi:glycogen debranching enzyme
MEEVINVNDKYYIMVSSSLAEKQNRVLKHGETFAVFDRQGAIRPFRVGDQGLYHAGTRHLSHFQVKIGGRKPLFLSSMVKEDNDLLVVDSANPDFTPAHGHPVRGDTLHLFQSCFLWDRCCYLRLRVSNFSLDPVEFPLEVSFGADFSDIFEVRGMQRDKRGQMLPIEDRRDSVVLGYRGLDGRVRRTALRFDPRPVSLTDQVAEFQVRLAPHGHAEYFVTVACTDGEEPDARAAPYGEAYSGLEEAWGRVRKDEARLDSSNEHFNSWLNRSTVDLFMMITETPGGMYPYAGIPWYSTVFGRDGIITALQTLWLHPKVAAGVLRFLAARQAKESIPDRDAEPGKILHEMRRGEMAALGEIPFGLYYGTVDATPLFVYLAGRYFYRTGDLDLVRSLWPNIEAALDWCDRHGDRDGDGFVEYSAKAVGGLSQQGWKDSEDSVFHADGSMAKGPIALCEVQAYVYAAKVEAARLAGALGKDGVAERLLREAGELKARFARAFWLPELGAYALALDGSKRPCKVRSSNAGQCLFTGIAEEHHARRVADLMLSEDMFSGFGVRTVGAAEARYNPMSYHNGSVWPHDNALIALGLGRYGFRAEAVRILEGQFGASLFVDLHRLPELYCGFIRRPGEGPTLYPVACNPQAWASASVYMMLEACLGVSVDARAQRVVFHNPVLPSFLGDLRIRGLRAGDASVDLVLRRHAEDVTIEIARRSGKLEIVETK